MIRSMTLKKLRGLVATLIAALVLSVATPPAVTKASDDLIRIDSLTFSYEKGYTAYFVWDSWVNRGTTTKLRFYKWLETDPDPDLAGMSYTGVSVLSNGHIYTAPTPGIYEFAIVGTDDSNQRTTEPLKLSPVDLRVPYGTISTPFNKQSTSRSIEVKGAAPTCDGCELFIRVENASDHNSLYGEYEVLPEEWPSDSFTKIITLDNDAPPGVYHFFAVMKQAGNSATNIKRYGHYTLTQSEPSINMQHAVNKYDLTLTWTESDHPDYAYTMIKMMRPGNGYFGDVEQVNKVGAISTYTYTNLWPGEHQVVATTYDSSGKEIAVSTTFVTIVRDGPPAVWTLSLEDEGNSNTLYSMNSLSLQGPYDNIYDKIRFYFKRSDGEYDDKYSEAARSVIWNDTVTFDFGLPPAGSYSAKVVTVDRDGTESVPIEIEDISFQDKIYKPVTLTAIDNKIYRNSNKFTVSGQATFHHFTELHVEYLKDGTVEGDVTVTNWNRNNGQFSATVTLPQGDTDDYQARAYLYDPVTKTRGTWENSVSVEYDETLPHLPTGIEFNVDNDDITVDWDHPEVPDYDSVELVLRDHDGVQVATVSIPKENNTHTFADLDNGIYTVSLTTVNANGYSPDIHTSSNLAVMNYPTPVLDGAAQVITSSGIFTISGVAELCLDCRVYVSVYNANKVLLEEIAATNWSPVNNTFSVTSGTDRPNGTYLVTAKVKLDGYPDGPESAVKTITVTKSSPGPSPVVTAPEPPEAPVIAPAPSIDETIFYLTNEPSEHGGFNRSVRLSVDERTVNQDTQVKVRKQQKSGLSLPAGFSAKSDAFALSSSSPLNKLTHLTLQYSSADLDGVNPEKLGIYRQSDTNKSVWTYIGGVVNKNNNSITTPISGPGTYAILSFHKTFQDLDKHWSIHDVETLVSRQMISGTSPQSFEPDRAITRAEAVRLLIEALYRNSAFSTIAQTSAISFNDVSSSAWYHDYVTKAASLGIVKGDDKGAFRPDDPVTREQFAAMIHRLTQGSATSENKANTRFKDESSIASWAAQAVAFATDKGIIQGMSDGYLYPQGQTTRAQAAAIVLRMMRVWGIVSSDDKATQASLDATIYNATGDAMGWAVLTPHQDGVRLQLNATGLKPGKHGFHIHEKAFTWLDFKTAGGHFNPEAKKHGHDNPNGSHLGDMPNLVADKDGNASLDLILKSVSIVDGAKDSLIGKSIIIHAAEDDYKSDPAGNAGDRIAGGIIAE